MRGGAWFAALVLANISVSLAVAQKGDFNPTIRILPVKPTPAPAPKMILPPEEFDRPYDGDLTIRVVPDLVSLQAACGQDKPGMLGCAWHNSESCVIYLVEDKVMRERGYNTGTLLRHEIGHCNGWPPDHPRPRAMPVSQNIPVERRIKR
jgi:hypothetical protein